MAATRESSEDVRAGALNLLEGCVRVKPGERLLIVGEHGPTAFFDAAVCTSVANVARQLGVEPEVILVGETSGPEDFPEPVTAAMQHADHTVFFTRLGDQLRFCPLPGSSSKTMCYTLSDLYLAHEFGRADFSAQEQILSRLMAVITAARRFRITCADGTELQAELPTRENGKAAMTGFSLNLFPVMIFPPLDCSRMSGELVLKHFLTSSSTHAYQGSVLRLNSPMVATIDNGSITGFRGPEQQVIEVTRHFERVAETLGGDPFAVNSWHAGVNPRVFYAGDPDDDIEKWATVAYGSPRMTHFHACGNAPGDIALYLNDATICFDDEVLWRDGELVFLRRPDMAALHEVVGDEG